MIPKRMNPPIMDSQRKGVFFNTRARMAVIRKSAENSAGINLDLSALRDDPGILSASFVCVPASFFLTALVTPVLVMVAPVMASMSCPIMSGSWVLLPMNWRRKSFRSPMYEDVSLWARALIVMMRPFVSVLITRGILPPYPSALMVFSRGGWGAMRCRESPIPRKIMAMVARVSILYCIYIFYHMVEFSCFLSLVNSMENYLAKVTGGSYNR